MLGDGGVDVLSLVLHFRIFVVIVSEENPNSADCMLKTYLVLLVDESRTLSLGRSP